MLEIEDLIPFILSFFGGGGFGMLAVKLFIQNEAEKAVSDKLKELKEADNKIKKEVDEKAAALHGRINFVENEYVTCKFCNMQHSNLSTILSSMDRKLDILIDIRGGKK